MNFQERYIARLEGVMITRDGEVAIVEYKEEGIPATCLTIGPEIDSMSDADILSYHNEFLYAQQGSTEEYQYVAVEIPPGKPQMERSDNGHWR